VNALSAERTLSPSRVAVTVGAAAAVALAFASAFSSVAILSSNAWIRGAAAASPAAACCVTLLDDGVFVAGVVAVFVARCASPTGSWAVVACAPAARLIAMLAPSTSASVMKRDETDIAMVPREIGVDDEQKKTRARSRL
jgi:hypothetical protein